MSDLSAVKAMFAKCSAAAETVYEQSKKQSNELPDGKYVLELTTASVKTYQPKGSDDEFPMLCNQFQVVSGPDPAVVGKRAFLNWRFGPSPNGDGTSIDAGQFKGCYETAFGTPPSGNLEDDVCRWLSEGTGFHWDATLKTKGDYQNVYLNRVVEG